MQPRQHSDVASRRVLFIGPFELDLENQKLSQGSNVISLRPKPMAVLVHLAKNAGRIVSQRELYDHVWPGRHVTKGNLRACIHDIRQTLGDDASSPSYIETVGRRGYRFIGGAADPECDEPVRSTRRPVHMIGRSEELERLQRWWEEAAEGSRILAFLQGEAGAGKTTLVKAFLQWLDDRDVPLLVGRGQCLMQVGREEPYQSVIEAFYDLCRQSSAGAVADMIRDVAPAWLALLPDLISEQEHEVGKEKLKLATTTRMRQLFAELVATISIDRPLLLVFEDLHWGDPSTLQLLNYLARFDRRSMRLLVLVTYRSNEPTMTVSRLVRMQNELKAHRLCRGLGLAPLTHEEVGSCAARHLDGDIEPGLAFALHQRAGGNPLFTIALLDHMRRGELIHCEDDQWRVFADDKQNMLTALPEEVGSIVDNQFRSLPKTDQSILAAASIVGESFTVEIVAACLGLNIADVESVCDSLSIDFHFLEDAGASPGCKGSLTARYRFRHALYRQAVYERLSRSKRSRLHLQIGEEIARLYRTRLGDHLSSLAHHFEEGGAPLRASSYYVEAAEIMLLQHAANEAYTHCQAGLALLPKATEATEALELRLLTTLGTALIAIKSWSAAELLTVYPRVAELGRLIDDSETEFKAFAQLRLIYFFLGDLAKARQAWQEMDRVDRSAPGEQHQLDLNYSAYQLAYVAGEPDKSPAIFDHDRQMAWAFERFSEDAYEKLDASVGAQNTRSKVLWYRGYSDQALALSEHALDLARKDGKPWELIAALQGLAYIQQCRQHVDACEAIVDQLAPLTRDYGLPVYLFFQRIHEGWIACKRQSPGEVHQAIARAGETLRELGMAFGQDYLLMLEIDAALLGNDPEKGAGRALDALAFVEKTGIKTFLPEIYRRQGLAFQLAGRDAEAERAWLKALAIAQRQQAKSFELRAALHLAELANTSKASPQNIGLLAAVFHDFTEGFDTEDLRAARALLAECEG